MTDPTGMCPATSIPRPQPITPQTLLAGSVPVALCTSRRSGTSGQIIPGKRHGIPNTGKSRVPVLSSVVHWKEKEGREEEKDLSDLPSATPAVPVAGSSSSGDKSLQRSAARLELSITTPR